jgi:type II secretion system protein N
VLRVDSAHARVSILPLLFGSVRLSFGADAFDGSLSGHTSESDGTRHLEVELEDLGLDKATLLADVVGLPLAGTLAGKLEFALPEGKLAKADGTISLKIKGLSAGDGKAKIRDVLALPKVEAGDLTLEGEATTGTLKITTFAASGPDLELASEGNVRLRDPMQASLLTLSARFRFTERYMGKNDMTRSLFGAPGSSVPGLFDMDGKNRKAKGPDGFYGWRVTGPLSQPQFIPHPTTGGAATKSPR